MQLATVLNSFVTALRLPNVKLTQGALLFVTASLGVSSVPAWGYGGLLDTTLGSLCHVRASLEGDDAEDYSEAMLDQAQAVLLTNCEGCHLEGGLAVNAGAAFILRPSSDPTAADFNYFSIYDLVLAEGPQYLLDKAVGAGHGGGVVLDAFGNDYSVVKQFVDSLSSGVDCSNLVVKGEGASVGGGSVVDSPDPIDIGAAKAAELLNPMDEAAVLRRAAIVLGRRLPSSDEIEQVRSGSLALADGVAAMLKGKGFHQFLLEGANDQLLMEAFNNGLFPIQLWESFWPRILKAQIQLYETVGAERFEAEDLRWEQWIAQNYGLSRAPLELIAYVVENNRSYKEVVTADYTMVTPLTGDIFNADVEWGEPLVYDGEYTAFHYSFKKGFNDGQLALDQPMSGEVCFDNACIPETYSILERPHAGVLSTVAFHQRYPTTETNRNRARARWAYQFFLGVDIEASAARTTDPEALADTNNPTLNNPACTVCHEKLDPVAGTFQNYDEFGVYRANEGLDSLPNTYKYPDESTAQRIYQDGDTWFRDMRTPGFNGREAPDNATSVQWLGLQIANDARFPVATVEFWWPAVMGKPVIRAPEDPSLPRYAEQLAAFNLQRAEINRLATEFVNANYRLKPLLVQMALSPWFTASSVKAGASETALEVVSQMGVSGRRLLTPSELSSKTEALTGMVVGYREDFDDGTNPYQQGVLFEQRTLYGGIDSYQVQKRTRTSTAIMAQVGENHAAMLACLIGALELQTRDGSRTLLNGIDFDAPISDNTATREIIQGLYQVAHGRNYAPDSDEVNLLVELLEEGQSLPTYLPCPPGDSFELDRLRREREQAGSWIEAYETPTYAAWRTVLNYMFAHFDYLYE